MMCDLDHSMSYYENVLILVVVIALLTDSDDILLASSAKDCYIRLWRISQCNETNVNAVDSELKLREVTFSVAANSKIIFSFFCKC